MTGCAPERVAIIVVNFNGGTKLQACLAAMRDTAAAAQLIVVDNASTDGSIDALAPALRDQLRLIRNRTNGGYAAALNQGAAAATSDVVVFCNMDVVPERGWLEPLLSVLNEHPDAGAVNPLIVLADGDHVNAAGQVIHVTGLGFNRDLGRRASEFGTEPFEVSGIQGAAFAIRRDVLEKIGGIDEVGFLYHEDVNLSWLLRLAGYRLYCAPRSRVRHDYFLSMYAEKFHLLERNRVAMLLAYTRRSTRLVLAPFLALTEAMSWGYAMLRQRGFVSAKWRSYLWVRRHRRHIALRRQVAERCRRVSDFTLLRKMSWAYDWSQFRVLARERGESRRRPDSELPI